VGSALSCHGHIQYVPKVLEQMSNIWTRLEVASAHTPDAVCLELVCVHLCMSVCICKLSTIKSNFWQYLGQMQAIDMR